MKATIYLEDGSTYVGNLFGFPKSVSGELVFQTGMVGYTESLTDPSYARQFLILTYPLIGNYGVGDEKQRDKYDLPLIGFESNKIWPSALIVNCIENEYSHFKAVQSLSQWLTKNQIPGLSGIDVRSLTKKIREKGSFKAKVMFFNYLF